MMTETNNAATQEVVLHVEGMTCNHCKMLVENNLKKTPGVTDARVDLAARTVTADFDPATTSRDQLANVIEQAGYRVKGK